MLTIRKVIFTIYQGDNLSFILMFCNLYDRWNQWALVFDNFLTIVNWMYLVIFSQDLWQKIKVVCEEEGTICCVVQARYIHVHTPTIPVQEVISRVSNTLPTVTHTHIHTHIHTHTHTHTHRAHTHTLNIIPLRGSGKLDIQTECGPCTIRPYGCFVIKGRRMGYVRFISSLQVALFGFTFLHSCLSSFTFIMRCLIFTWTGSYSLLH